MVDGLHRTLITGATVFNQPVLTWFFREIKTPQGAERSAALL